MKLRPGDLVEVKTPAEISNTLDQSGTLDQLPFMPEMVEYCGGTFRVSRRVVKICASGMKGGSVLRAFPTEDVFTLEAVRCSGVEHDGCQKSCMILWKKAWLRKIDHAKDQSNLPASDAERLRARLRTRVSPTIYFCQASELLQATKHLSRLERYTMLFSEIRAGNCSVFEMLRRLSVFLFWKARRAICGIYASGKTGPTPTEALNLQSGELVRVKLMDDIRKTLDEKASNRRLWFSPAMRLSCGKPQRVERRIDKLIVDGTGEMRHLRNSVFLEGSFCGCAHIALGGCSRCEYVYWREIWLQRVNNCHASTLSEHTSKASAECAHP